MTVCRDRPLPRRHVFRALILLPVKNHPPLDDPRAPRLQLEIIPLEPHVPLEPAPFIPCQPLLVLGPDVRVYPPDVQPVPAPLPRDGPHGVKDALDRGGGQPQPAVRREQHQALDVQGVAQAHGRRGDGAGGLPGEAGRVRAAGRVEGAGLEAADEPAHDLGRGLAVVPPEDGTAEQAGLGRVEDRRVEGVGVVDGEEEGVDAPQGGDVGVRHGDDGRGGVGRGYRGRQGRDWYWGEVVGGFCGDGWLWYRWRLRRRRSRWCLLLRL